MPEGVPLEHLLIRRQLPDVRGVLKILSYVDRQLALREIETGTVSLHNVAVSTLQKFSKS